MSSRRQRSRAENEAQHWSTKQAWAGNDPAAQANLAWDRLRAAIKDLPPAQQAQAWQEATEAVDTVRDSLPAK